MLLMFSFSRRQNAYSPLYFLESLGMSGLAVTLGALFFQALTILLVMRPNKLHFGSLVTPTPLAAE